ncbi:hypothetical protein [Catellatospora tritici]|uniref:hypothetical protein n=1 Tax=Catellatospora tritici TaxID=2851566 RepID=UPI001C2CFF84|nr:hypothetical protein [Catellatospora tritici]MBV1856686.1 hypothetical protein [Catellatospora tritici]
MARTFRRVARVLAVLAAAAWLGAALHSTQPVTAQRYRDGTVAAAQDSLSAVVTTQLAADAHLHGKTLPPYLGQVLGGALAATSKAQASLTGLQPPDAASAGLRDEAGGLIARANRLISATTDAVDRGDDTGVRQALPELAADADALRAFVERHR